jgi:hypothetical protein
VGASYAQTTVAGEVALELGIQCDKSFIGDELEIMHFFLMA